MMYRRQRIILVLSIYINFFSACFYHKKDNSAITNMTYALKWYATAINVGLLIKNWKLSCFMKLIMELW
jgi:hypothetical protein